MAKAFIGPLFFAYKDRENICRLIKETLERLSSAVALMYSCVITAKDLWKNITHIMNDSVSKNVKIEDLVAEKLGSKHIPYHLLCKSHVVEKLDASNLDVLAAFEERVKLRQCLEAINPALKPFFRGKKAVVVADIQAILKLVSYDKSGNSSSLAEEFDFTIEREGAVKHMSLYHERRFTKLGYSAASILQALPLLQSLLEKTWKSNLLVQACKICLDYELFLTQFQLLAYFTKKITLPFLKCVEKWSQEQLLEILPPLYQDLLARNTNTLEEYQVEYKHVIVEDLANQIQKDAFSMMYVDAAAGIKLQCGGEYGFGDMDEEDPRATQLYKFSKAELKDMPTNNINAEGDLAKFSQLAVVAKFRNKQFTAKGICNDIVLYQSSQSVVDSITKKINKVSNNREKNWNVDQETCKKKEFKEK